MAEQNKNFDQSAPSGSVDEPAAGWKPTAAAKAKATTFRWIAAVLWAIAIAAEAVGIFWLLRLTHKKMSHRLDDA